MKLNTKMVMFTLIIATIIILLIQLATVPEKPATVTANIANANDEQVVPGEAGRRIDEGTLSTDQAVFITTVGNAYVKNEGENAEDGKNLDGAEIIEYIPLEDWASLVEMAKNDTNVEARRVAVFTLGLPHKVGVAIHTQEGKRGRYIDETAMIPKTEAEILEAQAILLGIAQNDNEYRVRQVAVAALNDQSLLANITNNDDNVGLRIEAVQMLEDQTLLAEIAKTDVNERVRREAIYKLEDQTLLAEIAKNDAHEHVRGTAAHRLEDQALLIEIAKSDSNGLTRGMALMTLNDQTLLAEIAKNDSSVQARILAMDRLTNQTFLAEFARKDSSPEVRGLAAYKLDNPILLAEIVESDDNYYPRSMAKERLRKLKELSEGSP